MNAAIEAERISKLYRLGTVTAASLQEDVRNWLSKAFGRRAGGRIPVVPGEDREGFLWALSDVSFKVAPGEVVGIIGKNGAGKSTLLKILSRITRQTQGTIFINGRTSSLLEVGTGFHPELTGRDNVYLNGAILGMKRHEINARFEQIVEFSGVGRYLDTPVKRYSSGMKVRLGFAVAAHLDSDILIVDEVLAVGDFEFQRRCLDRMRDVVRGGRAVLFVSHSMESIANLTERCLLIESGRLRKDGPTPEVIADYLGRESTVTEYHCSDAPPNKKAYFESATLEQRGEEMIAHVGVHMRRDLRAAINIQARNSKGTIIYTLRDTDADTSRYQKKAGHHRLRMTLPTQILAPDTYYLTFSLAELGVERFDFQENILAFRVTRDSAASHDNTSREGILRVPVQVDTEDVEPAGAKVTHG